MRIALLSRAVFGLHGYGGMERHVLELARFLVRAGIDVTLVTMRPNSTTVWNEPGVAIRVVAARHFPLHGILDRVINYPIWSRAAGAYLVGKNFDLVHAQGASGWGYALQLARGRVTAPLIINPQGMEEFKSSLAKRAAYTPLHILSRQAAQRAAALIAADSAAATEIPRFLHAPAGKVVLIPNGIDVEAARQWVNAEARRQVISSFGLQQSAPILLSVGRLEGNKGFDIMLDALARIRPALPSRWTCLLVGDGPQRAHLQSKINRLKLKNQVKLLGALDDPTLHNLYEIATLFVHPTLFEGSSLVTLEAMAHHRPVVATAVGGIPDKVLRGRNGYLVRPGDAHGLGEKILLALRDAPRLREMGEVSYQIARQSFDWPITIQQTLALYERVTNKPTPQPQWVSIDSDAPVLS